MRKAIAILLLAIVGYYFINVFFNITNGERSEGVRKNYLENT